MTEKSVVRITLEGNDTDAVCAVESELVALLESLNVPVEHFAFSSAGSAATLVRIKEKRGLVVRVIAKEVPDGK